MEVELDHSLPFQYRDTHLDNNQDKPGQDQLGMEARYNQAYLQKHPYIVVNDPLHRPPNKTMDIAQVD